MVELVRIKLFSFLRICLALFAPRMRKAHLKRNEIFLVNRKIKSEDNNSYEDVLNQLLVLDISDLRGVSSLVYDREIRRRSWNIISDPKYCIDEERCLVLVKSFLNGFRSDESLLELILSKEFLFCSNVKNIPEPVLVAMGVVGARLARAVRMPSHAVMAGE